jgi:NTE family protein
MMWRPISIAKKDWALKPRVALALSGGGFRASLFHLGVLKRLAEVNLLSRVEVVSTVSGGSILGAFLVLRWQRWLEAGGDAAALESIIIQPFRELLANHNFLLRWIVGCWQWPFLKIGDRTFSRTQAAADVLGEVFFEGATCDQLPNVPLLVINATSLQSMRAWRFTKWGLGDSRVGHAAWNGYCLPLGICVGASAAFPPVFPPVRIPRRHYQFPGPVYGESPLPEYPFVPLTDGGVYDNMGLEALIKRISIPGLDEALDPAEFLVVSDGDAPQICVCVVAASQLLARRSCYIASTRLHENR